MLHTQSQRTFQQFYPTLSSIVNEDQKPKYCIRRSYNIPSRLNSANGLYQYEIESEHPVGVKRYPIEFSKHIFDPPKDEPFNMNHYRGILAEQIG